MRIRISTHFFYRSNNRLNQWNLLRRRKKSNMRYPKQQHIYAQQENVATLNLVFQSWLVATKWTNLLLITHSHHHHHHLAALAIRTSSKEIPRESISNRCITHQSSFIGWANPRHTSALPLLMYLPWLKMLLLFLNNERAIVCCMNNVSSLLTSSRNALPSCSFVGMLEHIERCEWWFNKSQINILWSTQSNHVCRQAVWHPTNKQTI